MKFSRKLLLWTTIIIAITLSLSGFYFVNYVFRTSLEREIEQALDENSILRFAFQTAALNVPLKYDLLQDGSVEQIATNLETSVQGGGRLLRLSNEEKRVLYASDGFEADGALLEKTEENRYAYRVIQQGERYYTQTASSVNALGRVLYLETLRDVSQVFAEREMGFTVYRRLTVLMLVLGIAIMHFIASRLTKPIRLLMKATKEMAAGDYGYRAEQVSSDELGQLTQDFNHMSEALEKTIGQLEEEVQSREEFVGAFAHELKTPLTSIIGYADMLRSRKLDEEKSFRSANYIYTEGKRLETMSLRLLDIMVTKKEGARMQKISTEMLFEYLQSLFLPKEEMDFRFSYEQAVVTADAGLIQTVLVNLIDNACKASEPGSRIEVEGHVLEMPSVEWEQADKGKAEKQDRNRAEGRRIEKQDKVIAEGGKAEKADKGKKEKGRAEQEKNDRAAANEAFEKIRAIASGISIGTYENYETLDRAYKVYTGLSSAEKNYFPDMAIVETIKSLRATAEADLKNFNTAKEAEKDVRRIVDKIYTAHEEDQDPVAAFDDAHQLLLIPLRIGDGDLGIEHAHHGSHKAGNGRRHLGRQRQKRHGRVAVHNQRTGQQDPQPVQQLLPQPGQ